MLPPELTLEIRGRTPSVVAMTMSWRDLLFLHFACEPEEIQKLLPEGLSIDTYPDASGKEMAWIGLVPFRMERVHVKGLPRIRSCEDFPETNVRTYCHHAGREPGVWFFSLDAANPFACAGARRFFNLNYQHANMMVRPNSDRVVYDSVRRNETPGKSHAECRLGKNLPWPKAGSLEFFLLERYLLYSSKNGSLFKGQVFHAPYQVREVEEFSVSGNLVEVNRIVQRPFTHAIFSHGVDVRAGWARPI